MLNFVSPMPPRPNGIADYALVIAQELAKTLDMRVITDDCFARTPPQTSVHDPQQMFNYVSPADRFNYQIGNNPDHGFVLDALLRFPGVVTLHDLNLLYLYETTGQSRAAISDVMVRSNPRMGRIWSLHQREGLGGNRTKHFILDMLPEILESSQKVIVHSQFAKEKIALNYGEAAAAKVEVIPHFAPPSTRYIRERCRSRLGLRANDVLILTSGFATKAKRFDWVVEALGEIQRSGRSFQWVHAGEERANEFPLTQVIQQNEELRKRTTVTGFLSEDELDSYIGAADIVLNLRFPSVGESSGTLARSYAAGACCVVSDTAAYAGIPCDRVVHIPVLFAVRALVCALKNLIDNPNLRKQLGSNARAWAERELSVPQVARRYRAVFDAVSDQGLSDSRPRRRRRAAPQVIAVDLEGSVDENDRRINETLGRFMRSGRLVLRFSNEHLLNEQFRQSPLQTTLAKHGLTAEDMFFRQLSEAGAEPVPSRTALEVVVRVGL